MNAWIALDYAASKPCYDYKKSGNGIISVSKHFLGYDSWTNNDLPVTMMSSVRFTHISDRPAVFDENIVKMARQYAPDMVRLTDDLWGTSLRAWAGEDFKRPVAAIIDAGNDILMISYTSKAKDVLNIMMELSESDSKYKSRIEESAARILKLKYEMGILKL